MEIPLPEEAFNKSSYYKIDRMNDRKGFATVICLFAYIVFFTTLGFIKDPHNVFVDTTRKTWVSGDIFSYVHFPFLVTSVVLSLPIFFAIFLLQCVLPTAVIYLNSLISILSTALVVPILLFYLGMNNGLSHYPIELLICLVVALFHIYKSVTNFKINWTVTSIVFNATFSMIFKSIIVLLPSLVIITIFGIGTLIVFRSIVALNLVWYPRPSPPFALASSVMLLMLSNVFSNSLQAIVSMFMSATVAFKLHENKGLNFFEALLKTLSLRLGSASFAIERSLINKCVSVCNVLLKTPLSKTKFGMKLAKFVSEQTSRQERITPFIFVGYYGHTYIHSSCGLDEKIKQSSMSGIVTEFHMREMVDSITRSTICIVMPVIMFFSYMMYGGSVSYFSLLSYFALSQVLNLFGAFVLSVGEIIVFDSIEQLAEGSILGNFSGLIQTLSENMPLGGFNRVN
ncbi:hypothetical protein EIN_467970 [Entamoeba invadens IP1]|uniref:Uncharacterized protein n=1 Tax=Entamoeba invadens IP1 TaxID=370355 RepID=A0A0A1TWH1_ENTIV|nr:hypothetical protein EIN_467970 [Entamoeba invadens IP1]ELP83683.1 hypothetical protein EIN_467970 [Entamoeba invadens IP1]|eukprot:XP_004183029.1 hypothetical protein EIN_467970 [Entamoeba invadens IP1]